MNWELLLTIVVGVLALAAVAYFALRAEKNTPPQLRRERKDPTISKPSMNDNENNNGGDNSGDNDAIALKKEHSSALNDTPQNKITPIAIPQGKLKVENFTPPELPPMPETLIELDMCYAARLYGDKPISAGKLESLREQLRQLKINRNYLFGLDELDEKERWRAQPEVPCRYWIIAIPLADRGGPISESDIQYIESSARAFVQKNKLNIVFPPAFDMLADAKRIDSFCAAVDMFVELRIVGELQKKSRIDEVMQIAGLVADNDRAYVFSVNNEVIFRSRVVPSPTSASRQTIIFEMDAPNISDPLFAFGKMIIAVRRIAQILSMEIIDLQGVGVDDARIAEMRRQLDLLVKQMREFGAEPGGAIARLIFA